MSLPSTSAGVDAAPQVVLGAEMVYASPTLIGLLGSVGYGGQARLPAAEGGRRLVRLVVWPQPGAAAARAAGRAQATRRARSRRSEVMIECFSPASIGPGGPGRPGRPALGEVGQRANTRVKRPRKSPRAGVEGGRPLRARLRDDGWAARNFPLAGFGRC